MQLLSFIGKRSGRFLIAGMILAALLPQISSLLRPTLPYFVSLILALGFAQIDFKKSIVELMHPRQLAITLSIITGFTVFTTFLAILIFRWFGIDEVSLLLVIVFLAAPPLSSSISLSIILGFNPRVALQVTLLNMLLTPLIGPICFAMAGIDINIELFEIGQRIATMILGALIIAFAIQFLIGRNKILSHKDAFAGVAVITMILFLFPLFDGVLEHIIDAPLYSTITLLLALLLNLGGHFMTRKLAGVLVDNETASAIGFMFGNRNVSIYLAALPFNPALSVFVAAAQVPIYITPALFRNKTQE